MDLPLSPFYFPISNLLDERLESFNQDEDGIVLFVNINLNSSSNIIIIIIYSSLFFLLILVSRHWTDFETCDTKKYGTVLYCRKKTVE